jgi:hypothetical protein
MRSTHSPQQLSARSLACVLPLCLLLCGAAQAQTVTSPPPDQPASAPDASKRAPEQTTQHIVVEDARTRIDEVRVGGETKSITVKPKDGMPAYDVAPESGERTWKVLGF